MIIFVILLIYINLKIMKNLILQIVLVLSFISSATGQQQWLSKETIINIAGKQRMLSQRIAKDYLIQCSSENYDSKKVNNELSRSILIFERNLETIQKYSNSSALMNVKYQWEGFKGLLNAECGKNSTKHLIKGSQLLLSKCQSLVVELKGQSESSTLLSLIDKSGRQRMISQKVCLYFMARKVFESNWSTSEFQEAFEVLDITMISLINSSYTTIEIEEKLGDALVIFEKIRKYDNDFLNGNFETSKAFELTNQLTTKFDEITKMYSELK